MAENEDGQEKKHDPGEKKWRDAAERGQIPRSADLGHAVVLFTAAASVSFGTEAFTEPMVRLSRRMFDVSDVEFLTIPSLMGLLQESLFAVLLAVMLPLGAALVFGTLANLFQSKFQVANKALEPKWDKLEPFGGFKKTYMSWTCLLYTSPSPRDRQKSRMPSSA